MVHCFKCFNCLLYLRFYAEIYFDSPCKMKILILLMPKRKILIKFYHIQCIRSQLNYDQAQIQCIIYMSNATLFLDEYGSNRIHKYKMQIIHSTHDSSVVCSVRIYQKFIFTSQKTTDFGFRSVCASIRRSFMIAMTHFHQY